MTLSCLWACCLCQVFEKKWEHFHQLICMLPFLVVVILFTFPQTASSLSSFSDLMRDVHARACVDTINEDVSSLHALAVTRVLHDGKKRDCSSSNLLPPFFFLNFFYFCFVSFFSNRTFSTPPPPELRESHSQFLCLD